MIFDIPFPANKNLDTKATFKPIENNIVFIGANGSGKSRLGTWIETSISYSRKITVHRISAHKVLKIPYSAPLKNLKEAEIELLFGSNNGSSKEDNRWGKEPNTHLLNDYEKLISLLFAKSAERDRKYTLQAKINDTHIPVPDAPIEQIEAIWSEILPHRKISFENNKVWVRKDRENPGYHGKEMSDGERITLYMLGQCLCAPENSIIIIDEPEMHLHKALVDKLWTKIEELSQNKLLIYITHDLDFAASRKDASIFWIKSYDGDQIWDWSEVPKDDYLPDSLILEILGSRKKIIFCEGEKGKMDNTLYQLIYPDFHIISRGDGRKVIEATKALRSNSQIHHLNTYGFIDSDYKDKEEIQELLKHGIYTNSVAEIENLCIIEPILRVMAEQLRLDPDCIINEAVNFIINLLTSEFEVQVSSKAEKIIEYKLGAFSKEAHNKQGIEAGLNKTLERIDISQIYKECEDAYKDAITSRSLEKLLLLYNRKKLLSRISQIFGLQTGEYEKLLLRLLKGPRKNDLIASFKQVLPDLK